MKKLTMLCVITLLSYYSLFAQVMQGAILVGGSINFDVSSSEFKLSGTTTEGPKTTSISFMPKAGYFFTDNLGAGIFLGISNSRTQEVDVIVTGDEQIDKTTVFSLGPWARYYIHHGDITHFFFEGQVGFGFGKNKSEYTEPVDNTTTTAESDINTFNAGIIPGASFTICKIAVIEFYVGFLGFDSYKTSSSGSGPESSYKTSSFGFNWNQVGTGITFFF